MNENYTQAANSRCFGLVDSTLEEIWADIGRTPEDTEAALWKRKLQRIAAQYVLSSRFALMRILCERAGGGETGFTAALEGEMLTFPDITAQHAQNLTERELQDYERLLMDIAARQAETESARSRALIGRALTAGEGKNLLLTRDEAFALGHTLGFSLAEMQWFLLRTLDTEDGLRYHASCDLIETFGFVTGMGEKSVAALKARCARMLADIPKAECDGREGDWTRAAGASLPQIAASWPVEEREERFLAWMREQAPYLDRPSRSALRIYRNLAVYAWHIAAEEESAPIESDFLPCIRELVSQPEEDERTVAALYENGAISAKKCRAVAGDILLDNLNRSFSDQTDKAKAYHVIAVRPDGQMTVSGGINASRTRVQDLLAGKAEVEKSDMLYLLWFTVGLCWLWNSRPRPSEIYDRLADFIDAAEICLDAAMLPPFYPPHLIEQSMLLSIVYAGRTESDTAEIYEQLCSAVIERRKSKNRP